MAENLYRKRLFWGVVIGLILRLTYLTIPILEVEPKEQESVAARARHLFEQHFSSRYSSEGFASHSIYPYMVALSYVVRGDVDESVARLLAIAFALGTIAYLYRLVKVLMGERVAAWAVLVYWLSPLSIIFTRTLLPESALVFCTVAALYHMQVWTFQSHNKSSWRQAVVFCTMAMLLRASSVYLWVPLLYAIWRRQGWSLWKYQQAYLLVAISGGITMIWLYAVGGFGSPVHLVVEGIRSSFSWSILCSLSFWQKILGYIGGKTLTPLGFLLALRAVWINRHEAFGVVRVWLVSVVFYMLLINQETSHEKLYLLPFLAVMAIYVGHELGKGSWGLSWVVPQWLKNMASFVVILSITTQLSMAYSLPDHYKYTREAGEELQNYAEEHDLILANRTLHYCQRKGWVFPLYKGLTSSYLIEQFELYRRAGVRYFVMTELENYSYHKDFLGHVLDTCEELVVNKGYRIYRLKPVVLPTSPAVS